MQDCQEILLAVRSRGRFTRKNATRRASRCWQLSDSEDELRGPSHPRWYLCGQRLFRPLIRVVSMPVFSWGVGSCQAIWCLCWLVTHYFTCKVCLSYVYRVLVFFSGVLIWDFFYLFIFCTAKFIQSNPKSKHSNSVQHKREQYLPLIGPYSYFLQLWGGREKKTHMLMETESDFFKAKGKHGKKLTFKSSLVHKPHMHLSKFSDRGTYSAKRLSESLISFCFSD